MTGATRYFGGGGDDSLAARRRCEKFYAGARRHHGVAMGIAREGKGAVGKRKYDAAVTHAMAIDHVGTHGHPDPNSSGCDVDDFDAQRLRRQVRFIQRLHHFACPMRSVRPADLLVNLLGHAQRPVKRGVRFSMNAATPSA